MACLIPLVTLSKPWRTVSIIKLLLNKDFYYYLTLSDLYFIIFITSAVPLDSPQNVSLVNVSAFALLLEWSSPDTPNGIITVYNIYVTYDNGSMENMSVDGSENSYLIGDLSPHQLVYVSISASTIAGEGRSTSRLEQRTGQASKTLMRPLFVSV